MKSFKFQLPIISVLFILAIILLSDAKFINIKKRDLAPLNKNPGSFDVVGNSGIAAMHIVLTAPTKILIIDKVEKNPVKQKDGRVAVSLEYDIETNEKRVLNLNTNTFCSAGAFLSNGTLVHSGGAEEIKDQEFDEGFESLRIFEPCSDGKCDWFENPKGLTSKRWYPTMLSLPDGKVLILGGSTKPLGLNTQDDNNPTYEFFPRDDDDDQPKPFPFLEETLPFNLYPAAHVLPGPTGQNHLFVFSNTDSIVWDWKKDTIVKRLPRLPGPPRLYPLTGTSVMLPLDPEKDYAPEILMCGGVAKHDESEPADDSCGRINLSDLNKADWEMDDFGGIKRMMPDSVILADGNVMFLNGAGKGFAGYNSKSGQKQAAVDPVLTSLLYDPKAPKGKRFTRLADSKIPRLYHSVATMVPDGRVFVTGSNPNPVIRTKNTKFPTEFRVEMYTPPYLEGGVKRHTISSVAGKAKLNQEAINVNYDKEVPVIVKNAGSKPGFSAALVHNGFVTHSVHMSQKYVICSVKDVTELSNGEFSMNLVMPPNSNMITPGINYLYVNNNGVPATTAIQVMIS